MKNDTLILKNMKKFIIISLISLFSQFSSAQNKILIHFNQQVGYILHYYITNSDGIFVLDYSGELEAVILGDYTNEIAIMDAINDLKFNRITKQFVLGNTPLYAYNLREIIYPDDYAVKDDEFKNYPIRINGRNIEYFDNYYERKTVKGKIKKIGHTKLSYFNTYYLPDQIKGKIKKIGNIELSLLNEYYRPEIIGFVKKIGSIDIKYARNTRHEELNNKVIQIGKMHIEYYEDYNQQSHLGMFKRITGEDDRYLLLQ